MCDQDHFEEDFKKYSRRDIGALAALGVSAAIIFPRTANAAEVKASFLIAVAENDDHRDPDSKNVLKEAFAQAKLPAEIEVYPAGHGWCPPDTRVYNQEQSEKAWSRLLALFEKSLG
jgi:dienelactone hydrolase